MPTDGLKGTQHSSTARVLLWWVLAAILAGVLYAPSFLVKPAGDDFGPPLAEIARGNRLGPQVFFQQSAQPHNYRPLQSLAMWAFGNISLANPVPWIHLLPLLSLSCYLGVGAMWASALRMNTLETGTVLLTIAIHPVLVGPTGGVDGFGALIAATMIWLGAWVAQRWADRPALAIPGICACMLIGSLVKEQTLSLLLIGPGFMLFLSPRKRWHSAIATGLALAACLALLMFIRKFTIPPGLNQGMGYLELDPVQWVTNAGLLLTSVLFAGNTVWVFWGTGLFQGIVVLALVGIAIIMIAGAWEGGIGIRSLVRWRPGDRRSPTLWLLGMICAMFPAVITFHVSEMYSAALVLPLAILAGLAATHWNQGSPRTRSVAVLGGMILIVSACLSVWFKQENLSEVGDRAELRLRQVLAKLPADSRDLSVALVYWRDDLPPRRTYSVFRMGEDAIVNDEHALDWIAPGRGLTLKIFYWPEPVDRPSGLSQARPDLILRWEPARGDFTPWSPAQP